ncbi:MAG TPA: sugar ABC transporter ATP-binding protein [Bradyrhizobium sp.]|nr:sugar ABC transporter ATP-binding protein [Bradyrhizobium sp.]
MVIERPLFEARDLKKSFGATQALGGVDFFLAAGEVHALVGENGAGKSSLIKVLSGIYKPDAGHMVLDAAEYAPASPSAAQKAGIALIPQELRVVPAMSVAENVMLGAWPCRRALGCIPSVDNKALLRAAQKALSRLGLDIDLRKEMRKLSFAERQLVVVARALDRQARVLILDEPTAALERREVDRLFEAVEALKSTQVAIMFVSHRLHEIEMMADRVTVMRDGKVVAHHPRGGYSKEDLVHGMTGRDLTEARAPNEGRHGEPVLTVPIDGVDPEGFALRQGQIVGLAGLLGNGSDEVLLQSFGAKPGRSGNHAHPRKAIAAGMGFVPGERGVGLVLDHSVRDNIVLPHLDAFRRVAGMDDKAIDVLVRRLIDMVQLRPRNPALPVRALSGGNQQKVAFARWLAGGVKVLLLDEPTHGIDVGAKAHIHSLIRDFADAGGAVLINSSEFHELLTLSDAVLAVREDKVLAHLVRGAPDYTEGRLRAVLGG